LWHVFITARPFVCSPRVTLYQAETRLREEGWPSDEFVYDGEHDLYRMADGEIAFSREYANERRLREDGFIG
jgi:hypothetical protein